MSDIIDQMDERNEPIEEARLLAIRAKAELAPGRPGECGMCGDWSARLVRGSCAPCRDKWKLP